MTESSNRRFRGPGARRSAAGFLSLFILMIPRSGPAQILDQDRMTDWMPGLPGAMPLRPAVADVRDFGAAGDSLSDDGPAFAAAMASLAHGGGTVRIPAGRYLLRHGLKIDPGVVFSGDGFRSTRLYFDLDGRSENAVEISKPVEAEWIPLPAGARAGGMTLTTGVTGGLSPGDFLEITRDNDPRLMYTKPYWEQDWADHAVGQIVRIESAEGGQARIETPLLLDYPLDLNAKIRRLDPVMYAGLEKLFLMRLDSGQGVMILLKHAAYCRVSEVESAFTTGMHVFLHTAYRCEVTAGYFHHAHGYGEGGQGYGVDCATHSTGNRIENNVLVHLRHALMAEVGASGNVFAYNYSGDPVSDDGVALADISLHGHYANHNLFEGNIVQSIGVGDYWGPAGPGNVFLRNVVESGEVDVEDYSHGQSFIGNSVRSNAGEGFIRVDPSVQAALLHGNRIGESVQWDPSIPCRDVPSSYYLNGKPGFWGDMDWPFQAGTDAGFADMPSQKRFQEGIFIDAETEKTRERGSALSVYPNPARGPIRLHIFIPRSGGAELSLVDMTGRRLRTVWNGFLERGSREWTVDPGLGRRPAPGIYLIMLTTGGMRTALKITVL